MGAERQKCRKSAHKIQFSGIYAHAAGHTVYRARLSRYAPDWEIIPDEAAVVRRIFAEWNGGQPLSHIAAGLNQDGIKTRNGKAWKHQQVLHIVRNGTYAGLRQWNGGEADGGQPAIVTMDAYRQAEQRQPKRGNPRGNPTFGRKA